MISKAKAIDKIEKEFPHIAEELHDETWDGLIHLQISVFSRLAQSAIDSGDEPTFQRVGRLFLELFETGEPELVNALNVSFLEHLNFIDGKKDRSWAYKQMSKKMRLAFDTMGEHNRKIHGDC